MSVAGRASMIETFETRRYAASSEKVTTVVGNPTPATYVYKFKAASKVPDVAALPRIGLSRGDDGTVYVRGTYGDDSVRASRVGGKLVLRTSSRMSYSYVDNAHGRRRVVATTTVENVYTYAKGQYKHLSVDGRQGANSLRVAKLPFIVQATSVETAKVTAYAEAPKGQTPSDPLVRGGPKSGWARLVAEQNAQADQSTAATAFFGDSHVSRFLGIGKAAWKQYFAKSANFGIPGDDTRHLLARIQGGLFDKYQPRNIVVSVGTNNFNYPAASGTDAQVYDGVLAVVRALKAKVPKARVILLGLLPQSGVGLNERTRLLNNELRVNVITRGGRGGFSFIDMYDRFAAKGSVNTIALIAADSHYTARGYHVIASRLADLLATKGNSEVII